MTCLEFFVWFGSGVALVPLLQLLKKLPAVGAIIAEYAWLLAPLLAAILPQIASALSPYCAQIDPLAWNVIMAALTYLVSQITYWIAKRAVTPAGRALQL